MVVNHLEPRGKTNALGVAGEEPGPSDCRAESPRQPSTASLQTTCRRGGSCLLKPLVLQVTDPIS